MIYSCIGNIQVVGLCRILSSKGINLLHNWSNTIALTQRTDGKNSLMHIAKFLLQAYCTSYLEISKAIYFGCAQEFLVEHIDRGASVEFVVNIHDMLQLLKEPEVYLGHLVNLLHIEYLTFQGLSYDEDSLICRSLEGTFYVVYLQYFVLHKAVHSLTNHTKTLLYCLLEITAYCHNLANRLH